MLMKSRWVTPLLIFQTLSCGKSTEDTGVAVVADTGLTPEQLCAGEGDASLVIGYGAADEFIPYESGESVGLDVAPQGGFGVSVRARTTGIRSADGDTPHATSQVLLDTYIDGELTGTFLNETVEVYCQDDGQGLIWGVVVGFDPAVWATADDLLSLDGQMVTLVVKATDPEGRVAEGSVDVVISVGR